MVQLDGNANGSVIVGTFPVTESMGAWGVYTDDYNFTPLYYVDQYGYPHGSGQYLTNLTTIGNGRGVVTNKGMIWLATNTATGVAPTAGLPNGSICTSTNGGFWVRTNGAWVMH